MSDFDLWNELKKQLNFEDDHQNRFPKEGEVWVTILGKNIGFEQNGGGTMFSRPILVIKKFNNHMFWVVPLSSRQKELDFYFNFTDPNNEKASAILAQLRLISIKRLKRKLYILNTILFIQIKDKIHSLL